MAYRIQTAPSIEPVTLQEAKAHLRIDSESFADDIDPQQSIVPANHGIAAAYSLKGSGLDVSGAANTLFLLNAGTFGVGGTVDIKLQHSNTDIDGDYEDVTDGAFAQVTEANDNAIFELAYTGPRIYVRAVGTVAVASCAFGVSAILDAPTATDDSLVSAMITAARLYCEKFQGRVYISQTWDLYLDAFPAEAFIRIPWPRLQSPLIHLKYKDTAGVLQTWAAANYIVDAIKEPGRVALAESISWPTTQPVIQAVQIQFVCGYGDLASDVPENIKNAIKLKLTDLYENRGDEMTVRDIQERRIAIEHAIESMLWQDKVAML